MTSFTYTFLFSRLLGGICAGMGVSIAPLYINEIVPQEIKGKLGSLVQFFITFGIFFAFTLCVALPVYKLNSDDNKLWIGIYGFPVVPSIIQLIFYWFVYKQDTPKWLFDSHRTNDLENVLKTIYIQDWEVYLAKIEGSGQVKGETQENANNPGYSALFNIKKYRKPLVLACLLSILQQLSGINTFIFYSTSIYQQITGTKNFANVFTAGLGLFNMLSTMFCLLFIEKYGRKVMLMQGCLGMCACHLALFLFGILDLNAAASLPVMLLYVGFFESSVGPVLWIYCSETLTDRGVGIAVALNWVFTGIIGLFPLFLEVVQISYAFLIFACICAGGFLFILLFIPETKGKTKEEFYNALE